MASHQSEKWIFLEAIEIESPTERAQFLDRACAGNQSLRSEVELLLKAHGEPRRVLDAPIVDPPTVAPAERRIQEGPGAVIGPYKLVEQIGEGGFGVVFMAEQTVPVRRLVAFKVLKPGMDTRQVVARFEAERQALAIMEHPNIARVFDGGETTSGRPYFVMELVRGTAIIDFCDQNHLGVRERLDMFCTVCHAVQHAHQKGIIHRDLKPSNVMVTMHDAVPVVKVIDFGIAKATGQQLTDKTLHTNFAQMVGTPMYMSPEQAQMSGLDIDTRTDIYALGVLLYELLTGTTPFDNERLRTVAYDELRRIIREEEPPKPSTRMSTMGMAASTISANRNSDPVRLRHLLRGDLDWIVMKCLEKDRNRRYETANSLAIDIQRYLRHEPVLACPPSAPYRLRKFARRNMAVLTTATLIAAMLVLGSVVSMWLAIRAIEAEGLARTRLEEADGARMTAISERDRAQQRLFDARLAQARASRWSRQVGQRFESWKAVAEAADLARELGLDRSRLMELRDEAIACLALPDVRVIKPPWEGFPIDSSSKPVVDPDIELYARSDMKGNISVRRIIDDRELALLPGQGPGVEPSGVVNSGASEMLFSPNAKYLAVQNWHQLPGQLTNFQLWDWQAGQCLFQPPFAVTRAFAFSPNGRHLILGQNNGTLTVHEVPLGKEVSRINLGMKPHSLAIHPNGSQLAVASSGQEIQVREMSTGVVLQKWNSPAFIHDISWNLDGVLLVAAGNDNRAYIWNAASGTQYAVLQGHQNAVLGPSFAPDNEVLLTNSWDGTSRFWDITTGRELFRLAGLSSAFSRNARRLLLNTGTKLTLLEVTTGREFRTLPKSWFNPGEGIRKGGFSNDGRWLAVGTSAGVRLWDFVRNKESAPLAVSHMSDAKFHPRGTELFTAGPKGMFRWPVRTFDGALQIGPARKLEGFGPLESIALNGNGQFLAAASRRGGHFLDLENSGKLISYAHENAVSVAICPKGEWIASGVHEGQGVRVWDANGRQVKQLIPNARITRVAASPDGRWLATVSGAIDIWHAGSCDLIQHIDQTSGLAGGVAAFAPDGNLVAIEEAPSVVRLLEPATGRPVARLQPPDADRVDWMAFSPDGSQLAIATGAKVIRVWNLRLIREQLNSIGLDWDAPTYPPAPSAVNVEPIRVVVDVGDFMSGTPAQKHLAKAQVHSQTKQWREMIEEYAKVLELQPDHSTALNNLAWCLANCADAQLRDVPRAVLLAQKAVHLAPKKATNWNTLGVAQYRAGEWKTAIASLEESERLESGKYLGFNGFFLAMAHWQLGDTEKAGAWLDRSVEWLGRMRGNLTPDNLEELDRFHAEARSLFGD